jgi:pimeloyl-ACP methyl ester carboxylesterase
MRFVLVHGGWQGGWAWDGVASALSGRGHSVLAPTLRGLEEGGADRSGVTLTDMGEGLVEEIRKTDFREFVLVGHSGGGPVAQFVADRLAGEVGRVVFMDASVLRDGEALFDVLSAGFAERSRAQAAQSPDGTVPIAPGHWSAALMQDATPEQLSACLPRLVPCPLGWFDDPLAIPRGAGAQIPASYVFLREDRSIPREFYKAMAARLGRPRTVECEGSHQAMITRPEAVAKALLASAGE